MTAGRDTRFLQSIRKRWNDLDLMEVFVISNLLIRGGALMKKYYLILVVLASIMIFSATPRVAMGQPKISNFDMSPKEIAYKTEVTISFNYENVEGGLKEAKVLLIQKIQIPGDPKIVTRTSNWQEYLINLSAYPSESGRFEKKFSNSEIWRGPQIELTYGLKVIDKNGKESNLCETKIKPK